MNNVSSPRTDDESIEQEIQRKALTAPRITPDDITAAIKEKTFHVFPGSQLTVCCLTLRNGFTVTGESACASPANFDAEIGERVALANATNKIWALEGYLLKERLFQMQQPAQTPEADTMPPHQRRVINERAEVEDRLDKLTAFLTTPTFEALPVEEQDRLVRQSGVMVQLSDVLAERIAAF